MEDVNLYAPPKVSVERAGADQVWRDGKVLVLRPEAALPHRCISCNRATLNMRERKLTWYNPWINVLILINVLVLALVVLVVRKRATIAVGLCEHHQQQYMWGRVIAWVGNLSLIGLLFYGFASPSDHGLAIVLLSLAGLIGLNVLLRYKSCWVWADRIDAEFVRVKGCGQPFLDALPEFWLRTQVQSAATANQPVALERGKD